MQMILNSEQQVILEPKFCALVKKETVYGYIYRTVNEVNGKIYIGQCKGSFRRSYLGSGDRLLLALKKYGRKNFSVVPVSWGSSLNNLNDLETAIIAFYRKIFGLDAIYNIADGGSGSPGSVHSKESRDLVRSKLKGREGRLHTADEIQKQILAQIGTKRSEETKKRMSAWQKGKAKGPQKPRSAETRKNMSIARLGRKYSKEHVENMRLEQQNTFIRRLWAKTILAEDAQQTFSEAK